MTKKWSFVISLLAILAILLVPVVWATNITVDGGDSDWTGISVAATDPDESLVPNQYDIYNLYCTQSNDAQTFYWRFDTHDSTITMNQAGGSIMTYMDTDQNAATGCSGFPGLGSERYIAYSYVFGGWYAQVYVCSSGSWSYLNNAQSAHGGNDYEAGATATQLGVPSVSTVNMGVQFENGDPQNPPDDSANATCIYDPTAVDLASFAAKPRASAIELTWETVSEVDNLGFHLYRAESPEGPRTRLNEGLIPSLLPPGSPEGAIYTFVDDTAVPGITYYYWLEDVDVYGVGTLHGPVNAALPSLSWLLPGRPRPGPGLGLPRR